MKKGLAQLRTQPMTAEREWTVDSVPVLRAEVSLPEPEEGRDAVCRRVRRYYQLQCRCFLRYCERFLLPRAAAEYRAALEAGTPPRCARAELTYRVTWNQGGLWSLYTQSREPDEGGRILVTRRGDTWDLSAGYPAALPAFFPPRQNWKRRLTALAAEEIRRREAAGFPPFHPHWKRRLRRFLNPHNFYLTDQGLVFFYPMYALSGSITEFLLPYREEGRTEV